MLNAPLNVNIYERTLTSSVGTFIEDLAPRLATYSQTISATCGFESMTCTLTTTIQEAQRFCERLFSGCIVDGKDADIAWEGFLAGVSYTVGDETVNISLDTMGNRVRVRYTTVLGTPGSTATASNATSIALYGTKDYVQGIGPSDATAAATLRDSIVSERAFPRSLGESAIATDNNPFAPLAQVTLTFAGWYTTLGWVLTSSTSTTITGTGAQVDALLTAIAAVNAFLQTTADFTGAGGGTGITDTEYIEQDTPYRTKIEALLGKGNSSNQRLAWGVYEGRQFYVATWAGATPTTVTYRRRIGDAILETGSGALVMPWAARPNAMLETTDLLNVGPPSGAIELPGRRFVERWTFDIDATGWRLSPEPAATSSIDARLARIG